MKPPALVVSPAFREQLSSLEASLPHAVILTGQPGAGLRRLASHLGGEQALIIEPTEATKTTHGNIPIDTIRSLYTETRGASRERQVVIIDDADRMSVPAQNAFLKLLEEPGQSVHFILTSHHPERLLPTVRSRSRVVRVPSITDEQSVKLLAPYQLDDDATRQILFVASGRPAELIRLAINPRARDELIMVMRDARSLLSGDRYQALKAALSHSDTLGHAERLLLAAQRLIEHAIRQSSDQQSIERLSQLIRTYERLQRGANPRLQLTRFVVQYH